MKPHKISDDQDHQTYSHVSTNEEKSTPMALESMTQDSQTASASTSSGMRRGGMSLPKRHSPPTSSSVNDNYGTPSSSVTEPPQKRQRPTGVQLDDFIGKLTEYGGFQILGAADLAMLDRDPRIPEIVSSYNVHVGPSIHPGGTMDPETISSQAPLDIIPTLVSGSELEPQELRGPNLSLVEDRPEVPYDGVLGMEDTTSDNTGRAAPKASSTINIARVSDYVVSSERNDHISVTRADQPLASERNVQHIFGPQALALERNDHISVTRVDQPLASERNFQHIFGPQALALERNDHIFLTQPLASGRNDHVFLTQPLASERNDHINIFPTQPLASEAQLEGLPPPRGSQLQVPINFGDPVIGQQPSRPRVLIVKELTESDIGINFTGIKLPKKLIESHFGLIPEGSQGLPVIIHDGMAEKKFWNMRVTVSYKRSRNSTEKFPNYTLKDTFKYLKHHSLEEGDWIKFFVEERGAEHIYIVTFEKGCSQYTPSLDQPYLWGKTWTLVIRKMLNKNDCKTGSRSVGVILLKKKRAEQHFPALENEEGFWMVFSDWMTNRDWQMKLKFTPHAKGRVYRLSYTGEFCKLHHLQQDDWLDILKSDGPDVRYALRAWKSDELRLR
ncbi:unnamed protein product [Calypogeia fissa]